LEARTKTYSRVWWAPKEWISRILVRLAARKTQSRENPLP
jgi:hypothetical protein